MVEVVIMLLELKVNSHFNVALGTTVSWLRLYSPSLQTHSAY